MTDPIPEQTSHHYTWTPEAGRATYVIGDVRDLLAATPDNTIDLVMTSPPFLALRSYLPADHPDKHREIGAEPDPAGFLDTLLLLTAEWRRVLAPHGSIAVELGDTYSGGGGTTDNRDATIGGNDMAPRPARAGGAGFPLPKSLCGIPHLYHLSLAYGRNLLTGEESPAGKWLVRNVVAWCRPNPPVGALGDKFRPATSYMTIATPSPKRYFDLDAVRNKDKPVNTQPRAGAKQIADVSRNTSDQGTGDNPAGAPPLDYWVIPTAPYSGSHFAVYPPALVEKPIKAMVPTTVCNVCGEPSRRTHEDNPDYEGRAGGPTHANDTQGSSLKGFKHKAYTAPAFIPTGWTDCGHGDNRPGIVLDPFAGSGTTLMVATGHGKAALGFDIDERNLELARDRVGPMLLDEATLTTTKDGAA